MRVLTLTWEFPPILTGGLGMACYGIAKALLSMGVELDLIIPTGEEVYFPLRRQEDADSLPASFIDSRTQKRFGKKVKVEELMEKATYLSTAYSGVEEKKWREYRERELFEEIEATASLEFLFEHLSGEEILFREVKDYTIKATNTAKRLDFDIIHAHDWLTYPAGMLIRQLSGKPLVVHVHSTEFDRAGGTGDGRIHHIEYMGVQLADRVIAVSGYTSNMIVERYRAELGKVKVIHNAFIVESRGKPKERIFKEPTVVFIGRITLQKGPDYFLEIARRVLEREKKVRFVMGGRGDMEKEILHKAASLGLGTKFLFAGFLTRQELEAILSAADIFIMPSVSEPFGIAPLEAMSHGAVAIISKQSGVAEIVKSAYKVDFWDIDRIVSIVLDLVENPGKLYELSRKSAEEVARLQWEEAGRKIVEVYRELQ